MTDNPKSSKARTQPVRKKSVRRWSPDRLAEVEAALSAVPKKLYRKMSGRPNQVLNEQADRYGIPLRGETVDVRAVIRWLHDWLAENGRRLAFVHNDDPLLSGEVSPALERYREERALLARMDRQEREKSLLPADGVSDALLAYGRVMHKFGDDLQRRFGDDAYRLYLDRLDQAERAIKKVLAVESEAKRP